MLDQTPVDLDKYPGLMAMPPREAHQMRPNDLNDNAFDDPARNWEE